MEVMVSVSKWLSSSRSNDEGGQLSWKYMFATDSPLHCGRCLRCEQTRDCRTHGYGAEMSVINDSWFHVSDNERHRNCDTALTDDPKLPAIYDRRIFLVRRHKSLDCARKWLSRLLLYFYWRY